MTFRAVDQCYKMTSPQRFHGVWVDEFEGSQFYPGRETPPDEKPFDWSMPDARHKFEQWRQTRVWLDVEHVSLSHHGRNGRAVRIDFIGRETLYAGHYGHAGMSGHEIIVDQVLEAKALN